MLIGLLLTKAKSSHAKYETVGGCWFQSVWHYREFFSIFRNICCAFTAHLFLRNYSLQFYNNRLLFYVEMCLQLIFCWANTNQARHVKPPTVCYLHVNIRQMSIINQSAFLIWNKATVGTLQYSIWKWNLDSNNAIRPRLMKVIPK